MKVQANFLNQFDAENEISDNPLSHLDEEHLHKLELIKKLGNVKNS